ncbi:MAG: molybdopterin converting factor [Phycisphaerae bacterium]
MRILFLNNSGAGFADFVDVAEGTTIEQLLAEKLPALKPEDLLIRVNRQPVQRGYVLQPEDRISATPVKIEGAA